MTTIADALQNAADALNNAVTNVLAVRDSIAAQLNAKAAAVTTIINNFNTRPLTQNYYVDPQNGNDNNDGLTYATSKKTIDGVLTIIGSQNVLIYLYGDTTILNRNSCLVSLSILGVQPANTPSGNSAVFRNITFLGTAENSPSQVLGNMSSGIDFGGSATFFTDHINFILPPQPANNNLSAAFISTGFLTVLCQSPTLTVGDQTAGALFGSFNSGRVIATLSIILGSGAAGHVFSGVIANTNPNGSWLYESNVTSA